jgi:hypothetical protein
MAKQKRKTGWVYSPTASEADKLAISNKFDPVIATLKEGLPTALDVQKFNYCVDVFSKWRGNFFYIMLKFKAAGEDPSQFFETGLARLEFYGSNQFNLSYFRHTGKWEPLFMYNDISFDEAKEAILTESMFAIM